MNSLQAKTTEEAPLFPRVLLNSANETFRRSISWLVSALGALCVLFFTAQIFGRLELEETAWLGDILTVTLGTGSVILAWRVTRLAALDDAPRRAWNMLMLAYFAYACGEWLWFFYSKFLEIEPFPSWADAGYLSFYPLMLCALLRFPTAHTYTRSDKQKLLMDVAIVMIGTSTVVWYFIVSPTLAGITGDDWLKPTLALAYVVGDMVMLLGIVAVLLRGVAEANRRTFFIIIGGLTAFAFADLSFAYLSLQEIYYSGHWIENFWVVGDFALLFSAHYQYQQISRASGIEEKTVEAIKPQTFSWLPYLAILLGGGMLLLESRHLWSEPLGLLIFASVGITALVVSRQVTAVKENVRLVAERAKQQSEMRFGALVQHSSDLIAILNLKGFFTYYSPSFKTVLGYEADELLGRHSLELALPEDLPSIKADFKSLLSDPQAILTREYHYRHKNGSWLILESITKTINDEENNISGILFNLRDVTERRRTENKLREFTVRLEQSNRELQDFAYVASHDLQEPLRKVQAFGDRLNRKYAKELGDEGNDYVRRMRGAADRMQTLINDLLTFSRVTTKAQPFVEIDLTRIANEVISDLEIKIEETKATVEIAELPKVDADPVQMRQLLQNLLGNALKFNRAETPIIKIHGFEDGQNIHKTAIGERFVHIAVEDNGIGFEEKYLDRIFTVFQRLHGRTEYEGSGVGLAVCRKIVERHGGTITAQSKPNEGAKFTFSLPVRQTQGEISNDK